MTMNKVTCFCRILSLYYSALPPGKVEAFLKHFVDQKDVTHGFADMDLGDEQDDQPGPRSRGLKYMDQLVCRNIDKFMIVRLIVN